MKSLVLSLAILLCATSATAGGIYTDRLSTPGISGAANTPTTLWSTNLPGGSISLGDAALIHLLVVGIEGTSSVDVKLGSIVLFSIDWGISAGDTYKVDLRITRTGNTTATTTGTVSSDALGGYVDVHVNKGGLAFTSAQTLSVVGQSTIANSLSLSQAGIQR